MRPWVVSALNDVFHTSAFQWIVPNYLLMLSLGAIAGSLRAVRRGRRMGLDPDAIFGLSTWSLAAALAGSRMLNWLLLPEAARGGLIGLLDPLRVGSIAYGGFIAGGLAVAVYLRRRKAESWRYLDCCIPEVGIGMFCARLGCLLEGDDFGLPTRVAWAIRFPAGSPAHAAHVAAGLLPAAAETSLPVHPTQIYLGLEGLALAFVSARWLRRSQSRPGVVFCGFWLVYAAVRFALEFLRGDISKSYFGWMTISQVLSVPLMCLAGIGIWVRLSERR